MRSGASNFSKARQGSDILSLYAVNIEEHYIKVKFFDLLQQRRRVRQPFRYLINHVFGNMQQQIIERAAASKHSFQTQEVVAIFEPCVFKEKWLTRDGAQDDFTSMKLTHSPRLLVHGSYCHHTAGSHLVTRRKKNYQPLGLEWNSSSQEPVRNVVLDRAPQAAEDPAAIQFGSAEH